MTMMGVWMQREGSQNTLGLTTNLNIFAGNGMIGRIVGQATGTAATLILDGTATTSSTASCIWQGTVSAGTVINLNFPVVNGLTVVPAGATLSVSWNNQ